MKPNIFHLFAQITKEAGSPDFDDLKPEDAFKNQLEGIDLNSILDKHRRN